MQNILKIRKLHNYKTFRLIMIERIKYTFLYFKKIYLGLPMYKKLLYF